MTEIIPTKELVLRKFTHFVEKGKPFIFTKFGDAEYYNIEAKRPTCGEHYIAKAVGEDLVTSLKILAPRKDVYLGDWKFNAQDIKNQTEWDHNIRYENLVFYDALLMHENKWLTPSLKAFYEAIQKSSRKKIYIGNEKLIQATEWLRADAYLPVRPFGSYDDKDAAMKFMLDHIEEGIIVMTSCGPLAKILAAEFAQSMANMDFCGQFIDFGSALDPLFIGNTRASEQDNNINAKRFFKIK